MTIDQKRFPISRESTAIVFNDMINSNLHTGNAEHDAKIQASGIIQASANLVAQARSLRFLLFGFGLSDELTVLMSLMR